MTLETIQAAAAASESVPVPADLLPGGDAGADLTDPPDLEDEDCPEARAVNFPLTDYGNGQRLVEYFGENIIFVPRMGWFRWDGRRWTADDDEINVRRDAQQIAAKILGEIEHIWLEEWQREHLELWHNTREEHAKLKKVKEKDRDEDQRKRFTELEAIADLGREAQKELSAKRADHKRHSKASGNSPKIKNMLIEATTLCTRSITALNKDPLAVNCENGVLQFEHKISEFDAAFPGAKPRWQVTLLPHNREQMISKMCEASYRPEASREVFERFLERIMPNPEDRRFLKRWFGYTMLGLTREQKLAFFFGVGRNGKSTLVDTIANILADYGTTLPIESLTGNDTRKGSEATPDLVRIPGARMVRASEPENGKQMKEALIKALTGGEAILIRKMHSEFMEITPEFKLTISGNHKPEVRGADDGIWRRIMLVPFTVQIPDEEVDKELMQKLAAERDGILAWMVEGALEYLEEGLPVPEAVIEATAEYREQSDPMRVFLTTECEITADENDFVSAAELRDAFNAWLIDQAQDQWGSRWFSLRLKEREGVVKNAAGQSFWQAKTNGQSGKRGIKLNEAAEVRVVKYRDELRGGKS